MKPYQIMTKEERKNEYDALMNEYERFKALQLSLNICQLRIKLVFLGCLGSIQISFSHTLCIMRMLIFGGRL